MILYPWDSLMAGGAKWRGCCTLPGLPTKCMGGARWPDTLALAAVGLVLKCVGLRHARARAAGVA